MRAGPVIGVEFTGVRVVNNYSASHIACRRGPHVVGVGVYKQMAGNKVEPLKFRIVEVEGEVDENIGYNIIISPVACPDKENGDGKYGKKV